MPLPLIAQRMLDEASLADASVVAVLRRLGVVESVHTISWSEGVSVGAVVVEAIPSADYTGEGSVLDTVTFTGTAPKTDTVRVAGPYPYMRHRITTPINDGGSVTSRIDGSA